MKADVPITPEFVECIPEELAEGKLYISTKYSTAVHKCFCGCGREVVTPLSPIAWQLTVMGSEVSLFPSIGSWSLPCRSHYWIRRNKAVWAADWAEDEIVEGRMREQVVRERFYKGRERGTVWSKVVSWLARLRG